MANNLAGRVWEIDTPGAATLYQDWWWAVTFYWFRPLAAGDALVVTDADDNPIWNGRAEVADQSQILRVAPMQYHGLKVPTLATGILQIHIR